MFCGGSIQAVVFGRGRPGSRGKHRRAHTAAQARSAATRLAVRPPATVSSNSMQFACPPAFSAVANSNARTPLPEGHGSPRQSSSSARRCGRRTWSFSVTSIGPLSTASLQTAAMISERSPSVKLWGSLSSPKEFFFDHERLGRFAGKRVGRNTFRQESPCGRPFRHRERHRRLAVLVRHDGRIPVGGLRDGRRAVLTGCGLRRGRKRRARGSCRSP